MTHVACFPVSWQHTALRSKLAYQLRCVFCTFSQIAQGRFRCTLLSIHGGRHSTTDVVHLYSTNGLALSHLFLTQYCSFTASLLDAFNLGRYSSTLFSFTKNFLLVRINYCFSRHLPLRICGAYWARAVSMTREVEIGFR